jgi:hypothetical protein
MFLFHNRVSQCLACYWGWSCQFVFVGSTVWLPYLLELFLIIIIIIIIIIIEQLYAVTALLYDLVQQCAIHPQNELISTKLR